MDNQDKPKGFKGLSKLVSDLSDLSSVETPKEEARLHFASAEEKPAATPPESKSSVPENNGEQSNSHSDDVLHAGAAVVIGFIVLLVIGAVVAKNQSPQSVVKVAPESQSSSASSTVDKNSQRQDVSESNEKPEKKSENVEKAGSSQYSTTASETHRFSTKMPPIGSNHVHSISEIRWCLAEGIRIDAVRNLNDSQADVAAFNRWVDDYNSRCGSYRYRQGSLASAKRDVEPYASEIRKAARETVTAEKQQRTASLTKKIQLALQSLGYKPGPADGIYGTKTAEAIEQYQRENNLWVTGKVSEELLESLKFTKAIR